MPVLRVPTALRALTGGRDRLEVEGTTLRDVFAEADRLCPGLGERLVQDGELRADIAVAIDGSIIEDGGILHEVQPDTEIYLVMPLGGGAERRTARPDR